MYKILRILYIFPLLEYPTLSNQYINTYLFGYRIHYVQKNVTLKKYDKTCLKYKQSLL